MQIIPTILEKDFDLARDKIVKVKNFVKIIQIDVIDGCFSFGKTFELELINKIEETENVLWEIHLMVKEPKNWIEKCNFIGAFRIIGQVEMMSDKNLFINKVKDFGLEAGLAFDIDTEINEIPEETDIVLLLSRKAGFGYQKFNDKIFEKIKRLEELKKGKQLRFQIGVDGGISENNIQKLNEMGVELAYCGSSVFDGMVEDNIRKLNYAGKNK